MYKCFDIAIIFIATISSFVSEKSVDDLKGGDKACDVFLTSFIFSLSVLMTLDTTTSLEKSSTWKNCTSGNTIDMVIY